MTKYFMNSDQLKDPSVMLISDLGTLYKSCNNQIIDAIDTSY